MQEEIKTVIALDSVFPSFSLLLDKGWQDVANLIVALTGGLWCRHPVSDLCNAVDFCFGESSSEAITYMLWMIRCESKASVCCELRGLFLNFGVRWRVLVNGLSHKAALRIWESHDILVSLAWIFNFCKLGGIVLPALCSILHAKFCSWTSYRGCDSYSIDPQILAYQLYRNSVISLYSSLTSL